MSKIGLGQALKDYSKTVTDTDTVGRGVGGRGGRGGRGVKKRKAAAKAGKPRQTRACSNKPPAVLSPPTSPSRDEEDLECDNNEADGDGEVLMTGSVCKESTGSKFAIFSPPSSSQPDSSPGGASALAHSTITDAFQAEANAVGCEPEPVSKPTAAKNDDNILATLMRQVLEKKITMDEFREFSQQLSGASGAKDATTPPVKGATIKVGFGFSLTLYSFLTCFLPCLLFIACSIGAVSGWKR